MGSYKGFILPALRGSCPSHSRNGTRSAHESLRAVGVKDSAPWPAHASCVCMSSSLLSEALGRGPLHAALPRPPYGGRWWKSEDTSPHSGWYSALPFPALLPYNSPQGQDSPDSKLTPTSVLTYPLSPSVLWQGEMEQGPCCFLILQMCLYRHSK